MRVVAAMSGGVDSSVAALRLKSDGHDVIGVTIKTWPKEDCGQPGEKLCCSLDAIQYARSVAEDLGIPYYVIDLSKEFEKEVTDYFVKEYSSGRTPNPCIYCNSKIKFGSLLRKAMELGAEKIATGHYARIITRDGRYYLGEAADGAYDQSYFLSYLPVSVLGKVMFPLGGMTKADVRSSALREKFMNAERKSSQDICFATESGGYREYLAKKGVKAFTPGDIIDTAGKVVGRHEGVASYTIGQRRGLGIGGGEPYYVVRIDAKSNTITIGYREKTMNRRIKVSGFNWLTLEKLEKPARFKTRIRYNGEKADSVITPVSPDEAVVEFDTEQFAPTPGQVAVFYDGPIVVGGGWIEEILD